MGTRAKMSGHSQAGRQIAEAKAIETATGCLPRELRYAAYSELAELEARAILAETEDEKQGSYQPLSWLGDWSADVAPLFAAFVQS